MRFGKLCFYLTILHLSILLIPSDLIAASKEVKVGVILPLSGPLSSIGKTLKEGAALAADMVNGKHPGTGISISEWEGIPNMGGARIKLIFVDSRGDPSWGAEQAKRLIKDEKVVSILGSFQSAVTKAASVEAEKASIPFINPDSLSPELSKRGLKWFWRLTPHEAFFVADLFNFLDGLVQGKAPEIKAVPRGELEPLAVAVENTGWGLATMTEIEKSARERGWKIIESFKYPHKATDLTSESKKLIASQAPTYLFVSYVSDAIRFIKTMKELKAAPALVWGQSSGFMAPDFAKALGSDVNGMMSRDLFSPLLGSMKPETARISKLFKDKMGYDLDGNSARNFIGVQVLAHTLNHAGSTDPEILRKALNEIHLPERELVMPWKGVKFGSPFPGDIQQNELGNGIIIQHQGYPGGRQEIVYPFELTTSGLIFPFPGWK
jgi:branched-chain amino acid transport system substrate-binding protein